MDVYGMSTGHPTITEKACPTVLSSAPGQYGHPWDIQWTPHPHYLDSPWDSTVPPELGPLYPTVRPIPLYHGTGGTVHESPMSHMRTPISHCPSYPTVPWDRTDCPWESNVPHEDPHIPLSVLSHCTMGQDRLSMGVHCPTWGPPYPTVCPIPLYHGTGGTLHGSPLSHLRVTTCYQLGWVWASPTLAWLHLRNLCVCLRPYTINFKRAHLNISWPNFLG